MNMMNRNLLLFWICTLSWWSTVSVYAGTVYTDCERPPTILHGRTELSVDDEGIVVTALYKCDAGYHLHGQSQLTCNTDTDEWMGDLPACKLETGNNSSVSEIEPPEPINTVPPEVTHEELGEIPFVDPASTQEQPSGAEVPVAPAPPNSNAYEPESVDADDSQVAETTTQKHRRKGKGSDFQEDNFIDEDFASRMDMSCMDDATIAPQISDAYIVEYIRARKEDFRFLVAIYACDEGYALENPQLTRLYCSQKNWVAMGGQYPACMPNGDSGQDYDSGTDDEDQNGIDNANKNDGVEISATNTVQANHEEKPIEQSTVGATTVNERIDANENNIHITETTQSTNEILHEIVPPAVSCDVNNGGCDQTCSMVPLEGSGATVAECSCAQGFYLDAYEGRKCFDINECEEPNMNQHCPHGCENTVGSYRCLAQTPDVEIIPTGGEASSTTELNAPVKACGDGLRFDDANNCIDIDECAEGNTGCEYCQNTVGSFQCTCPDGFELNNDEKTCRDIDECTTFSDYEYEENIPTARSICSHECINTVGSYICRCPANFHLRDDKRTCEQDFCRHLGEITSNKTKCSHDCVDEADGYHCKCPTGMNLDVDQKTCISVDACGTSGDRCLPGKCINLESGSFRCECPQGFAEHNQRCIDHDECAIGTHKCSHQCENIDGSYRCVCPDDLSLASDQHTCVSVDLCANDNGGCSDICNVVNEKVVCSCLDATELDTDGKTCRTKNICAADNGGCQHVCNQEFNKCECYPGFESFDDGKNCHDLNECLQNNGGCRQQCINREGGYECTCFDGFTKDEETGDCHDRNECETNNGNCDHECINTQGSYSCSCRDGFRISVDQHQCFDINECDSNNGNCSHTCINLPGSHQCSCPEGQFLVNDDQTCEFLNECEVNNGGCSHKCLNKKGRITCVCPDGFELDDTAKMCIDQNECLVNNGGCAHQCENLNGTHVCKCNAGYQLASDKYGCLDVDECIENNGNCSNICINLLGSYSCACEAGFELKADKHTCHDIDECSDSIHDCEHICINVAGAYECQCRPGFKLARDRLSCTDVDECALPNACDDMSKCVNTAGSYYCNCPAGFELSEQNQCVDKNECDENAAKRCSHECVNTAGSFTCACPKGMQLASDQLTCIDINECVVNEGVCSHYCDNIEGSFRCRCPPGYKLDHTETICQDIDECAIDNGGCEQKCVNIEGSAFCECNEKGFALADDKRHCISSDPCVIKNGGCAHVCEPMNGQAQCFCYKGFELSSADNRSCSDINECLLNHGCESKCINTVGSYKCDCPKGFRLNAAGNCEDVNECEVFENGGCSPNSECINFLGSFRCICPTGYKLSHDKVTCVEIKNACAPIAAPEHGNVRCSQSRHSVQLFYRTKCSMWCNEGYTLNGPSVKYCNGSDGIWDNSVTTCVASTCPPLPMPMGGTFPENCLKGKIHPGESCAIICVPGSKIDGPAITQCLPTLNWSVPSLGCVPMKESPVPRPKTRVQQGEIHSSGRIDLDAVPQKPKHRTQNLVRPYIKCPRDTMIVLPNNQQSVYVQLEQPKTNVNWARYVDASPPWAKNLKARLTAGVHTITFIARSPQAANINEMCKTVITVKSAQVTPVPQVHFCPGKQEVQMPPHQQQTAVFWTEPSFRSNQQLKQIFKSHLPGTKFSMGIHKVTYVATDIRNQNATCQFDVVVRPTVTRIMSPYVQQTFNSHLNNHESYLLCPGKPDMKLDTNFPIIPPGCIIKNVRRNQIQPYNPHRRRHAFFPNNNFLRYYSSWNRPANDRFYR